MLFSKHRRLTIRLFFCRTAHSRAEYTKKRHVFNSQGEDCYFWIWNFGTEPSMISIGNNVSLATNVNFINHDVSNRVFNNMKRNKERDIKYSERTGHIKIGDNVFVGAGTRILYDVTIGNNVIIGAGSLVNKDIPDGVVAAGVPCKVVGSFDDYEKKLIKE